MSCLNMFELSSEFAKRNITKLARELEFKTSWDIFRLLLWNQGTEFNEFELYRNQDLNVLYKLCVFRADQ